MPSSQDNLKDRLARYRQVKISVIGRKSGQTISIPVWFVLESQKLYLLPVKGSETQWYKNVLKNPSIRIDARGMEAEFRAVTRDRRRAREISDREVPREVRGEGREEVLFEIRRGSCGSTDLNWNTAER
jgi:hypothetical protein